MLLIPSNLLQQTGVLPGAGRGNLLGMLFGINLDAVPPSPGFWCQAVTAGFYGGEFRTPGDIFKLATASDFSDSTVNYQAASNGIGYGWMQRVNVSAEYDWLENNNAPYLPPQDPSRRTVY